MRQGLGRVVRGAAVVSLAGLGLLLAGCDGFFVKPGSSSGGSTSGTGNYAYVSNNVSSNSSISGYSLAKGTLAVATGSPYVTGVIPTAMVVSRNGSYLYVASTVSPASNLASVYVFSIGTGGALTILNTGIALFQQTSIAAMDVSPDGNWLIVTTAYNGVSTSTITAYSLNSSTGLLGTATAVALTYAPAANSTVSALKVAPSGEFISVALGTGGVLTFPFTTSTGAIGSGSPITFITGFVGAFDVAIDSNNLLYVAATGNIDVFSVSTSTTGLTTSAVSTTPTAAGGPFSLALDGTSYVYASASMGSPATYLIYAFSNKAGVLTALSTATIASPTLTSKLAVDSTGKYLLAQGYDSTGGLKLYSISSTGTLASLDTAATGTGTVPSALALTH